MRRFCQWLINGQWGRQARGFTLWLCGGRLYLDWWRGSQDLAVGVFWLSVRADLPWDPTAPGRIILGRHVELWRADRPADIL